MSGTSGSFAPVAAHTRQPILLAMQRLWLAGRVLPAGARLTVQHIFRSEEKRPLEAIYSFPLPKDAALRAFRIVGDGFEAHSELRPADDAVKLYESGVAAGSLSALARAYGDGLVNLTVGNIRPGETVTVYLEILAGIELRDDGLRFRFPFTLAPSYHARARIAVSEGEGEIELPEDEFGDVVLPAFRRDASGLHEVGFELLLPYDAAPAEIGSPSHSIRVRQDESAAQITMARESDAPNRDLVLDIRRRESKTEVLAGPAAGRHSFAAIVPSTAFGKRTETPRRIALLLDRSGSMDGAPIAQARKAIEACLAALSEADSFGVAAFDSHVEAMQPEIAPASRDNRRRAGEFLERITARGGTELAQGIAAAARMLGGAGEIMVVTDGQVFGTEAILEKARAQRIRLFCLGIGTASQDRFLSMLARETGGVSRFVTPRERVDLAALDLFASIGRPVATGLEASAAVQPEPPHWGYAGAPVILFGEIESAEDKLVRLTWDGGKMEIPIPRGDAATGETVRLLRGSRLITDWESRYPSLEAGGFLARRKQSRAAARLRELSEAYGLASREMALVAVVKREGDRPGELPETRVVPVGMPEDVSFGGVFKPRVAAAGMILSRQMTMTPSVADLFGGGERQLQADDFEFMTLMGAPRITRDAPSMGFDLVDLAAMLEPDGGMPGADLEMRAARSVAAVLAFVAEGNSEAQGAFRLHVQRLVTFLKTLEPSADRHGLVQLAVQSALAGTVPSGDWLALAQATETRWEMILRRVDPQYVAPGG